MEVVDKMLCELGLEHVGGRHLDSVEDAVEGEDEVGGENNVYVVWEAGFSWGRVVGSIEVVGGIQSETAVW